MTSAFVVRVLRSDPDGDELAGSVEAVDTGAVEVWHDPGELVAILRRTARLEEGQAP